MFTCMWVALTSTNCCAVRGLQLSVFFAGIGIRFLRGHERFGPRAARLKTAETRNSYSACHLGFQPHPPYKATCRTPTSPTLKPGRVWSSVNTSFRPCLGILAVMIEDCSSKGFNSYVSSANISNRRWGVLPSGDPGFALLPVPGAGCANSPRTPSMRKRYSSSSSLSDDRRTVAEET